MLIKNFLLLLSLRQGLTLYTRQTTNLQSAPCLPNAMITNIYQQIWKDNDFNMKSFIWQLDSRLPPCRQSPHLQGFLLLFVKLDMKTPHLVQQDGSVVGKGTAC